MSETGPPDPHASPPRYPVEETAFRPTSGALVAIGVLNIVFALVCGCWGGVWWATAAALSGEVSATDRETLRQTMQEQLDQAKQRELDRASSPEHRARMERGYEAMEKAGLAEALADTIIAIGQEEAVKSLATTGLVSILLKVLLLVGSSLLLARVRASRMLCLIALAGILFVTVYEGVLHAQVFSTVGDRMAPVIAEMSREAGQLDESDLQALPDQIAGIGKVTSIVVATLAGLYPLIAFLVILLSPGIKAALGVPAGERFAGGSY